MSDTDESGAGAGGGGSKKPKSPAPVVVMPQKRELAPTHAEQLAASGLTPETIALADLYTEHHHVRLAELVQRRVWLRSQGGAIVFPFYLPGESAPFAFRIKPTNPRVEKKKNGRERVVKYDQASGYGLLVYFPPRSRTSGACQGEGDVVWTEGEKKALALDQLGYCTIGLTGVWNWLDTAHRDSTGEQRLHPHVARHVRMAGRAHVICYDADARDNDHVMRAAQRLAGVLRAAGAVSVRFVCPPPGPHKGIDDYLHAHGAEPTRALLATAAELEGTPPEQPLQKLRSLRALQDAPIDDSLRLPEGYEVQRDGSLWVSAEKRDTRVAFAPIILTRRLIDHQTRDERLELAYPRNDNWTTQIVTRKAIGDARTLVAEAMPYGAPVTSNTAARVVDWLEAFEDANPQIPTLACLSSGGWHRVAGVRLFAVREAILPTAEDESAKPLEVVIDTRGDRRNILAALEPRGTLEAHTAALKRAWGADPNCAVVICAAFAATLLEPLRAPNFAVHLVGQSSRGKTTQLKIAASVFGDPNSAQWVASWNVSAAGAEQRATVLCDLPQCYDEVGGGDPQIIERLVYSLINGGGRTRAQRDMTMRETTSWRTIVLSTGEHELADESAATGAQVRVVQMHVSGFGELTATEVDALRDECASNAGRAGEEWLHYLVDHSPEDWERQRVRLRDGIAKLREESKADPLQGRVAAYFGLLGLCEAMLCDALGIGDPKGETMATVYKNASGTRDRVQGLGDRARELVEDWVLSEPESFPELTQNSDGSFDAKSKGKTRHGFVRPGGMVLLIRTDFADFCTRHGLATREVLREWKRLGWLQVDSGRGFDKRVRIPFGLQRFYALYPLEADDNTGSTL